MCQTFSSFLLETTKNDPQENHWGWDGLGGSIGCAIRLETRRSQVQTPLRYWQHSFMEIDHEIFSKVILSLLLIQEGQLSVSGERMCTILVNSLEDLACPVNVWIGKLTVLDMTPLGWLGRKTSTQTNKLRMGTGLKENLLRIYIVAPALARRCDTDVPWPVCSSVRQQLTCERNSSYSFWPIILKLHRCFGHGV